MELKVDGRFAKITDKIRIKMEERGLEKKINGEEEQNNGCTQA